MELREFAVAGVLTAAVVIPRNDDRVGAACCRWIAAALSRTSACSSRAASTAAAPPTSWASKTRSRSTAAGWRSSGSWRGGNGRSVTPDCAEAGGPARPPSYLIWNEGLATRGRLSCTIGWLPRGNNQPISDADASQYRESSTDADS